MTTDFAGHIGADPRPGFRQGQFVKLRLHDADKQAALIAAGAHAARDGSLVGIFVRGHRGEPTRAAGGEYVPPHFVLVTARGHNLNVTRTDDATGHTVVGDVWLHKDSAGVAAAAGIDHAADLPPHRVCSSRWLESLHDRGPLPEADHAAFAAADDCTPARFLARHAAAHPAGE